MTTRALALAALLLAITAPAACADQVLSSHKGGREGVGVTDNRLAAWAFLRDGRLVAIYTDSRRPVHVRCTAGAPGRRITMRATIEDGEVPAFFATHRSGARVQNMRCTATR